MYNQQNRKRNSCLLKGVYSVIFFKRFRNCLTICPIFYLFSLPLSSSFFYHQCSVENHCKNLHIGHTWTSPPSNVELALFLYGDGFTPRGPGWLGFYEVVLYPLVRLCILCILSILCIFLLMKEHHPYVSLPLSPRCCVQSGLNRFVGNIVATRWVETKARLEWGKISLPQNEHIVHFLMQALQSKFFICNIQVFKGCKVRCVARCILHNCRQAY